MRFVLIAALAAFPLLAADEADIWSNAELAQAQAKLSKNVNSDHFALETFGEFGNHNMLMVYREASGPSETHADWTDFYVVRSGSGTLLVGGTVTEPRDTAPGEIRGNGVKGARKVSVKAGDVVNIPPGTAHQMVVAEGKPITYLIVKVKRAD